MELPCTIGRTRDLSGTLQDLAIGGTIRGPWHRWREADTFVRQTGIGFRPRLRKFYRWRHFARNPPRETPLVGSGSIPVWVTTFSEFCEF